MLATHTHKHTYINQASKQQKLQEISKEFVMRGRWFRSGREEGVRGSYYLPPTVILADLSISLNSGASPDTSQRYWPEECTLSFSSSTLQMN